MTNQLIFLVIFSFLLYSALPLKESVLLYCALPSKDIVGYYIGFGEYIGEVLPAPSQTKTLRFLFAFC